MANTSSKGQELIKRFEGLRLRGYYCPANVATIGFGHTAATGELIHYADGLTTTKVIIGKEITRQEAERLFAADVDRFDDQIDRLLKGYPVRQEAFDAAVSLAYNIGVGAFSRSTCLNRLRLGDVNGAAEGLKLFNRSKGKVLSGLVNRRELEAQLMVSGGITKILLAMHDNDFGDMPQSVEEPSYQMAA